MSARSDERSEEVEATRNGEQYVYAIRSADHQLDQVAALSGDETVPVRPPAIPLRSHVVIIKIAVIGRPC